MISINNINFKQLLYTLLLASLWGPSFLLAKVAGDDVGPFALVTLRVGLGGVFLWLFLILKNKKIVLTQNIWIWIHSFVLGFFSNGFPFVAIAYSVSLIPTSLSALINGTVPILTILIANIFLTDEKLNWNRGAGILLGLSGFLIIFLPTVITQEYELDPMALILSFLASCSYAIGIIYARKYLKNTPPLVVPTLQLLTSLLYLIPLAWYFDWPHRVVLNDSTTWGCILGLATLGTAVAFILYHRIIKQYGATAMSMVTYLLPVIGTLLGVLFLEETISFQFWIASCLILAGILVIS